MLITWLGDSYCNIPELVGGKAANLSKLAAERAVPEGFCLTTEAFNASRTTDGTGTSMLAPSLLGDLEKAFVKLCELSESQPVFAVRSSAVDEDGGSDSFAGQHQTFLNVNCLEGVENAIRHCWDSLYSREALEYRKERNIQTDDIKIAGNYSRLLLK